MSKPRYHKTHFISYFNIYTKKCLTGVNKHIITMTSKWSRSVSNHQPLHCLFSRLFRRKSKITSKVRVTGLSAGNSPVTGEFTAQMASNAENVFIWWRHHDTAKHHTDPSGAASGFARWFSAKTYIGCWFSDFPGALGDWQLWKLFILILCKLPLMNEMYLFIVLPYWVCGRLDRHLRQILNGIPICCPI